MTSPDLSIPEVYEETETETETETTEAVESNHTIMRMIQLAEAGEISQSVKYIKKASDKVISKLYAEYLMIEQDKSNTIITDTLITKFSELMGMLETVPSGDLLAAELKEDKLLQKYIKEAVSFVSPFVPFIGLVTGGSTLGKHMMRQRFKKSETEPVQISLVLKKFFFSLYIMRSACNALLESNNF